MRSFSPRARISAIIAVTAVLAATLGTSAVADLPDLTGKPSVKAADRLLVDLPQCFGEDVTPAAVPGGPQACAHIDKAPPGVDVTKPVATAVLEARKGGAAAAVKAAQDEGVPTPASLANVTDRVPCDGDGTSGYRVQAMYVVTADKANRYASVADQIKQWAAGVNTVFNRSAAKTGGVRDVRYVTTSNGDGTCSPAVANITLPAGSFTTFNATITAMQNAGYTNPARKYLMWVDGTGQCGIAQTYMTSTDSQSNPNNGLYPQFARTDTACWGSSNSVEAHELAHTLGSVQNDAPHSTRAGHCFDESDRMCYSDGGAYPMKQICTADQEPLLDCNNDDYFSTYPGAGTYLDTHWNIADSRFLIGGGDGTGGGTAGVPTRLGGTVQVNNPAIPGVATQVQASPEVVPGRTVQVAWTSSRKDCEFADPAAEQTTITCSAAVTTNAPVTLTLTDSAGEKVTRTTAVTFDKAVRAGAAGLRLDGQAVTTYATCTGANAVLSTRVTDAASGAPVKGVTVAFFRKVGTYAPAKIATAITGADGVARTTGLPQSAATLTATTTALAWRPTVSTAATTVTTRPGPCPTAMTGGPEATTSMAGQPVKVSGTLTKTVDGVLSPAAGEALTVWTNKPGTTTWTRAATTSTTETGAWTATITPVESVNVKATLNAKAAYAPAATSPALVTVAPWVTALTATGTPTAVMAAAPVTVTGRLTQTDTGGTTTSIAKAAVALTYPLDGAKTATTTAVTGADGSWTVTVKPTGPGTLSARYAGKPGWPAATATAPLTVTRWVTQTTAALSASTVMAGSAVKVTGTLRQVDGTGTSTALAAAPVAVTYPTATGTATARTTSTSTGAFTATIYPTGSGTVKAEFTGKPGWVGSSASAALTANPWTTALTATPATTVTAPLSYVTVTGKLTQRDTAGTVTNLAGAPVAITYQATATKTATVTVRTTSTGTYTATIRPGATGPMVARYAGKPGWGASSSAPVTITVS